MTMLCSSTTTFAFRSSLVIPTSRSTRSTANPLVAYLPSTAPRSVPVPTKLYLFFGNKETTDTKDKELAYFPKLATSNTNVKYESLSGFIATWSRKFEEDRKGMGLTTPVKISSFLEEGGDDEQLSADLIERSGVRIIFQPTKTGYNSKKEEDSRERGDGDSDKKKKGPPKEGGVEISVEKMSNGEVQLTARRCETDEDTTIKEMSEEAIISQLKKAIDAWKKI